MYDSPTALERHEKRNANIRARVAARDTAGQLVPANASSPLFTAPVESEQESLELALGLRRGPREGSALELGLGQARRRTSSRMVARKTC
jgi:hypothetical protein